MLVNLVTDKIISAFLPFKKGLSQWVVCMGTELVIPTSSGGKSLFGW